MTPTGFVSYAEYFKFMWAREFRTTDSLQLYPYSKNLREVVGECLAFPLLGVGNYTLSNIKNPLMITTLAAIAMAGVTAAFYPNQVAEGIRTVIPQTKFIKHWMIKASVFAVIQSTLLGVAIRNSGRLGNQALWVAWTARNIIPISIGTIAIPKQNVMF